MVTPVPTKPLRYRVANRYTLMDEAEKREVHIHKSTKDALYKGFANKTPVTKKTRG